MSESEVRQAAERAYDARAVVLALSAQSPKSGTPEEQRESFIQYHVAKAKESEAFAALLTLTS